MTKEDEEFAIQLSKISMGLSNALYNTESESTYDPRCGPRGMSGCRGVSNEADLDLLIEDCQKDIEKLSIWLSGLQEIRAKFKKQPFELGNLYKFSYNGYCKVEIIYRLVLFGGAGCWYDHVNMPYCSEGNQPVFITNKNFKAGTQAGNFQYMGKDEEWLAKMNN